MTLNNQKYLTEINTLPKKYSVISAFVSAIKPLITPSSGTKKYGFNPSGMGRTRIGEALKAGKSPLVYYNQSQTVSSQALQRELLIREFWRQAPNQIGNRRPEKSWYDGSREEEFFKKWKAGETGHLLVDAGMRQLAEEGWMPNRVRMACASFLTKNLRIWWVRGADYFASKLVDYNPDSNTGNWLWVSSAGFNTRMTDVISPSIQLKKYDPSLLYCRSILGSKRLPVELKAADIIRDTSLYIPQITLYEESKKVYLKSLSGKPVSVSSPFYNQVAPN